MKNLTYQKYTDEYTMNCDCLEGTIDHRLYVIHTQQGLPGDLYNTLNNLEYKKYQTMYSNLSNDEIWSNEDWNQPVEILKEVITRNVDEGFEQTHYAATYFIYSVIMTDEELKTFFTEGQYWTAKYEYKAAEKLFLDELKEE